MAAYADFDDTYILSQADLFTALVHVGSRCDAVLRALAPYGGGAQTVPKTLALYAQTYTVTVAGVNAILAAAGSRGHKFLTVLLTLKA